jgi:WD40 repeat protein
MPTGELRLWNLSDGKEIRAFEKAPGEIVALAFPDREKLLAVVVDGKTVIAWDAMRGKRLHEPIAIYLANARFTLSPDGKLFAFPAGKDVVSVRSVADGKEVCRVTGHTEEVRNLAFSADGGSLAVCGRDDTVRVWDMTTGKNRSKWKHTPGGLSTIVVSPDGKTVASGGANHPHAILFWDAATGRRRTDFAGHIAPIYSLAFSPDGKQVATASWMREEAEARLWDAATGRLLREIPAHKGGVCAAAFSPDGKTLATSGWIFDRTVKLWDTTTGKELRCFTGHKAGVICLAFSPDGKRLASGDNYYNQMGEYEGRVRIWDLAAGKEVLLLAGHKGAVQKVAFDPDGKTILVAASAVHRYDLASGEPIGESMPPTDLVESVALSPDGKFLLTSAAREPAALWEFPSGKAIHLADVRRCFDASFSPNGRFLALGTDDEVCVFDRADGKQCLTLRGVRGRVSVLAFSPDGRMLAAAGNDTSALLWDVTELSKRPLPVPKDVDAAKLDRWWTALKGTDAEAAERAAWALAAVPDQAISRLKAALQPVKPADARRIAKLLADLDNDKFETREQASRDLETIGEAAAGELRDALRNKPSAEQRRRIDDLLARLKGKPGGEWLRTTRAIAVLERIGTPDARSVLETLAAGAPGASLTRDAHAALTRLKKREEASRPK